MASRTCYLHIGTPKTGSSTIQGFLHTQRDALMAAGVDVPDFGVGDIFNGGVRLSNAFAKENILRSKQSLWKWLDTHIQKTDGDLCISRESFCRIFVDRSKADEIARFFRRRKVKLKVIAYVRDPVSLFNALYTQGAKRFVVSDTFDAWAQDALKNPPTSAKNLSMFRHLIHHDDIDFAVSALPSLGPNGLIGDFTAKLDRPDFDWSGYDETAYRNPTPDARTMAASIVVASMIQERSASGELTDLYKWREHGRQFRKLAAGRGWNGAPFYGPDPDLAARIEALFARKNDRFAELVWKTRWADMAPSQTKPRNVYDLDAAPESERREIMDLAKEFVDGLIADTPNRIAAKASGAPDPGRVSADFPSD